MIDLDLSSLVSDGLTAYSIGRDSVVLTNRLVSSFKELGAEPVYPSLRIKAEESVMEFETGLQIKKKFFGHTDVIRLDLPPPSRVAVYGLRPYKPLPGTCTVRGDNLYLDAKAIREYGDLIKITLEYQIDKREAITGLVYTSSPKDNKIDENSGEEIESYWLEAGLKSKQLLREIYTEVTIQDVALKVEVGLREHIKELFSNEFRTEMIMMAKFNSSDRNERKKAIFYREHHSPKFQGNIFKVIDELQEIMQPKRFRQFLSLEDGNFRFKGCERGMSLGDPIGPIYLPAFMDVFSATDLTLEEPAKSDNLIYKKGQFQKKVEKVLKDSIESRKKANRAY